MKERPEALLRSPSRSHFRPPFSLTFGFRLWPSRPASSYVRSVLGARTNLGGGATIRKGKPYAPPYSRSLFSPTSCFPSPTSPLLPRLPASSVSTPAGL